MSVWSQFIARCANYAEPEDVLLKKKHTAFVPLLLPLVSVIMINEDMTELVKDGKYGWLSPPEDLEIILVDHRR